MAAAFTPLRQSAARASSWTMVLATLGLVALGISGGIALALGELQALYVCLAVLGALAVAFDFRVGVVLLMVLLPISGSTLFPHNLFGITGLRPLNVVLIATFGAWLLKAIPEKGVTRLVPRQLFWLYIAPIVIAGAIGSQYVDYIKPVFFHSGVLNFDDGLGYLRDMVVRPLFTVLIAVLVGAALARSAKPENFLVPILIAAFTMSLLAIGFVLASGVGLGTLASAESRRFFSAMGMHANDLGRFYALAYALLLFTWAESKDPWLRTWLLGAMALVVAALALTFSRGAFFGFVVVNALFLLWRFNLRSVGVLALAASAALLLLPEAVSVIVDRMTAGFDSGDWNAISAGRIDGIWMPLLPEVAKSPVYGNGLSSIMWADAMYADTMLEVTHPHNAYLEALLDLGIAGLLLILAYFAHVWRGLRKLGSSAYLSPSMRGFYQGAAAALVAFLVTGMAGSSLLPRPEHAFLWLAIGMMYGQLARRPAS
jgi:O-antigen ligase